MEHSLTTDSILPLSHRTSPLWRLAPLLRYVVFLLTLFGVTGAGVLVRLNVQQLRKDMDRTNRHMLEARVLGDRLTMELEARRRVVGLERAAKTLGMSHEATLIVEAE